MKFIGELKPELTHEGIDGICYKLPFCESQPASRDFRPPSVDSPNIVPKIPTAGEKGRGNPKLWGTLLNWPISELLKGLQASVKASNEALLLRIGVYLIKGG